MNALDILIALEDHDLVAVDARGQHCTCGAIANFLEHYAAVGLEAADVPGSHVDAGDLHLNPTVERNLRRLLITPTRQAAAALLRLVGRTTRPLLQERLNDLGLGYLLTTTERAPARGRDDEIRALWAEGLNDTEIGDRVGMTRRRVQERRSRLRLPANAIRGGQRKAAA